MTISSVFSPWPSLPTESALCVFLAALCAAKPLYNSTLRPRSSVTKDSSSSSGSAGNEEFHRFQLVYLGVYLLAVLADWLQGPFVYALYRSYGYSIEDIGSLFIVGFLTSGVFGMFVGGLADSFGRKKACLMYCILYALACLLYHSRHFYVLLLGRFLGGVSTSLLFSVFEAWMLEEHAVRGFDAKSLNDTFAKATLGNGTAAIVAGVLSHFAAVKYGPIGPFQLSAFTLVVCGVMIILFWNENHGGSPTATAPSSPFSGMMRAMAEALKVALAQPSVLLCGLVQSCFESAMYVFVFMWTPALPESMDPGTVFTDFMIAMMIGSEVFESITSRSLRLPSVLPYVLLVAAAALAVPCLTASPMRRLLAFCIFEACCGVYFPTHYSIRSSIVPASIRATMFNLYRIPLNVVVAKICTSVGSMDESTVFATCSALLAAGALLALKNEQLLRVSTENKKD
ncbi:hypothetical protein FOZ61_004548 [Perkinsus olseni]|uniref:Molybdate-anion transporter n=1 Tax=Perkinsus olseni TaxID=32597 RepID=A0A7J6LKX7_PEROL|nr:hypothetical protein FOZ61_004548 [Perkinsus olseni]